MHTYNMYTGTGGRQTGDVALPTPKRSRVDGAPKPTDPPVSIDDEATLPKPNKFAPKLLDMGFKEEDIQTLPSDGLLYVEVLDKMLQLQEETSPRLRPHTRTHLLVLPTALTINEPVLARWPQNGGKYVGRIAAIHGDILRGFTYDVLFWDGDWGRGLLSPEVRSISEKVRPSSRPITNMPSFTETYVIHRDS